MHISGKRVYGSLMVSDGYRRSWTPATPEASHVRNAALLKGFIIIYYFRFTSIDRLIN